MKNLVIISNLTLPDFNSVNGISKIDKLKYDIISLHYDKGELFNYIKNWANIKFLRRVSIILENEDASNFLFTYLTKNRDKLLGPQAKVTIKENYVTESQIDLCPHNQIDLNYENIFHSEQNEPSNKTLFKPSLKIDTQEDRFQDQLPSPTITLNLE